MAVPTILTSYINSKFVDSESYFDNINPVDGSVISKISEANTQMIDDAVEAAKNNEWAQLTVIQRCVLLHKVADLMQEREQAFIDAEITDTGKSLFQVKTIDIPRGTANFRFFADLVKYPSSECFITETVQNTKALNYSVNKPLGVVAIISPWNLPLLLATWKIAPAMACGNSIIFKPSEETSSTAFLLAQVMDEVGIPKGAFNLIPVHNSN